MSGNSAEQCKYCEVPQPKRSFAVRPTKDHRLFGRAEPGLACQAARFNHSSQVSGPKRCGGGPTAEALPSGYPDLTAYSPDEIGCPPKAGLHPPCSGPRPVCCSPFIWAEDFAQISYFLPGWLYDYLEPWLAGCWPGDSATSEECRHRVGNPSSKKVVSSALLHRQHGHAIFVVQRLVNSAERQLSPRRPKP